MYTRHSTTTALYVRVLLFTSYSLLTHRGSSASSRYLAPLSPCPATVSGGTLHHLHYSTILYPALPCAALPYSPLHYPPLLYSPLLYSALLYSTFIVCSTVRYALLPYATNTSTLPYPSSTLPYPKIVDVFLTHTVIGTERGAEDDGGWDTAGEEVSCW